MGWPDIHAHLTHPRLWPDVDAVLARAQAAGVGCIVSNGLDPTDNEAVLALAERSPLVRPALGFYPVDAVMAAMQRDGGADTPTRSREAVDPEAAIDYLEANIERAFAVGEIGLDGYWVPERFWPQQDAVFRRLVTLAIEADRPIIIHTRKREPRALEILRELAAPRVVWHCFGGKVKLARQIAEAGHYLSIPANARRSQSFTRMLETLPRERLLLETDCPYLSPEPGERNEPANVAGTAAYAAELWHVDIAEVKTRIEANFEQLFRAPASPRDAVASTRVHPTARDGARPR